MSIDEIIGELELRGVKYDDCTNKSQLLIRLNETRSKGIADPNILSKFNDENISEGFDPSLLNDKEIVSQVAAKDGNLPGGLSPELVKALTSDPEIMNMLRNPKMQEVMKAVMTQGPDGIKRYLSDPDAMILLQRLSKAMERAAKL
uniref:STI1/HOP DP domain-containing protein n=1 Tax=Chromulina nebulosa TaxID=96789 RepID=A0A7S0XEQ7_9STRA